MWSCPFQAVDEVLIFIPGIWFCNAALGFVSILEDAGAVRTSPNQVVMFVAIIFNEAQIWLSQLNRRGK